MFFETERDFNPYFSEKDNVCNAHFHRSAEILYILKGNKTVWINGERYDLSPAQMLVCPPYAIHAFVPSAESVQIVACVLPEYCKRFEAFSERYLPESYAIDDPDGTLLGYLRMLWNAENDVLREGAAEVILGTFISRTRFVPAKERTGRSKIHEIAGYIDAHYAEPLTLAGVAGKFGYAPNYFSALFKRYFRIGFAQYVNSVRVRKSVPLLKTQKASSVCYDCGFRSPQQYFLNFRKVFGCTPYEYLHDKRSE